MTGSESSPAGLGGSGEEAGVGAAGGGDSAWPSATRRWAPWSSAFFVAERGAGTGSARTSLTNDDGDVQAGSWKERGDDEASR
jgi:hypothetical protein